MRFQGGKASLEMMRAAVPGTYGLFWHVRSTKAWRHHKAADFRLTTVAPKTETSAIFGSSKPVPTPTSGSMDCAGAAAML